MVAVHVGTNRGVITGITSGVSIRLKRLSCKSLSYCKGDVLLVSLVIILSIFDDSDVAIVAGEQATSSILLHSVETVHNFVSMSERKEAPTCVRLRTCLTNFSVGLGLELKGKNK